MSAYTNMWFTPFSGNASGPGPRRGILRYLLATYMPQATGEWREYGQCYVPVRRQVRSGLFSQDRLERMCRFQAWGFIMALHSFHLIAGPSPISPFLYFFVLRGGPKFEGRRSLKLSDLPAGVVRALDPRSADLLDKWSMLSPEDPLPLSPTGPHGDLFSLCLDAFGGQTVSIMHSSRL